MQPPRRSLTNIAVIAIDLHLDEGVIVIAIGPMTAPENLDVTIALAALKLSLIPLRKLKECQQAI